VADTAPLPVTTRDGQSERPYTS